MIKEVLREAQDVQYLDAISRSRSRMEKDAGYSYLKEWVQKIYADNKVTKTELKSMGFQLSDIDMDLRVAIDLQSKMDPKSAQYAAAETAIQHLYQCKVLMANAFNKGRVYNDLNEQQKMRRDINSNSTEKGGKTKLKVCRSQMEADLVNQLVSAKSRIEAEKNGSKMLSLETIKIDAKDLENRQLKLTRAINQLQKEHYDAKRMNLMLGYERE